MTTHSPLVRALLRNLGGAANVMQVTACATRLRFSLHDAAACDLAALRSTPGVQEVIADAAQVQVVTDTAADAVRDKLLHQPGWEHLADAPGPASDTAPGPASNTAPGPASRATALDTVFDFLSGTFSPLIAPITAAAMVLVVSLLLTQFHVLDPATPTARLLDAAGNAIFYFLPLLVAFTASRKLGANPYVGAVIAAALLHPSFVGIAPAGTTVQAFGLPLFMHSYASSMFPALLLALALAGLDRLLVRVVPRALQQVLVPTVELLTLVPITALVVGPIGVVVGEKIGAGTNWLATTAPLAFYIIVPAVWIFLVTMGIHWALITIALAELASSGTSVTLAAAFGYQYAMVGIAVGVFLAAARRHRPPLRDTAAAASLTVAIGGITEPTIYGLVLPHKRVLAVQMVTAAASGLVLGLSNAVLTGFSPAPILSLPLVQPFLGGLAALVVGTIIPVIVFQLWDYTATPATHQAQRSAPAPHPETA